MSVAKSRGIQITEFSDDVINPEPIQVEETDILLEDYLSPTKLKALTGVDDLDDIKLLEMKVDTSETSLGNFGSMVPNLKHLKLNNSMIASVRDLGTSLENLQVLWMARCCLQDLDGISSMARLQELYLAYNEVTDVSPCSMLENLQLLDLEGNCLDDTVQVEFLALCSNLKTLTLEGNPLCIKPSPDHIKDTRYDYRAMVKRCIPHLEVLDDDPLSLIPSSFSSSSISLSTDWLIVNEAIKDSVGSNESLEFEVQRPGTANRPGSSAGCRPGSSAGRRPGSAAGRPRTSAGRPASAAGQRPGTSGGERPGSGGSDIIASHNDVSDLTHGEVICGNPARKLRERRKQKDTPFQQIPKLFSHHQHQPEKSYDVEEEQEMTCEEIFNELKQWKKDHEKKIAERKKASEPQVLKITHDDDDDDVDENNDEDLTDFGIETSPPPSMHNSSPTPPRSPSPKAPLAPKYRQPSRPKTSADFRSRMYRHRSEDSVPVEKIRAMRISQDDDTDEALGQSIGSSTHGSPIPAASINDRPFSGPVIGSRKYKAPHSVKVTQPKIIDNHQPVIRSSTHTPPNLSQRLASLNRPATARAALQKQVLPSRTRPFPS
ncbi:leucine-rich repeat-containing protein 56-like [Antedon mediterranea]|uniref:leucine-rich repeat-containing protein 56-like n=1 Tax=Antedon mediterranea TaxID=105859 RepID=UPI003AF94D07